MKKMIIMVLVLVMLASIFVMPAMAAEIQPRYLAYRCLKCEGATTLVQISGTLGKYHCDKCDYDFWMPIS